MLKINKCTVKQLFKHLYVDIVNFVLWTPDPHTWVRTVGDKEFYCIVCGATTVDEVNDADEG